MSSGQDMNRPFIDNDVYTYLNDRIIDIVETMADKVTLSAYYNRSKVKI